MGILSDVQTSLGATPHAKDAAAAGRTLTAHLLLFHISENPRLRSARHRSCCVNPRFRTIRYAAFLELRRLRRHTRPRPHARTRLDIHSRHVQTAAAHFPPAPRVLARYSYAVGVGLPMDRA